MTFHSNDKGGSGAAGHFVSPKELATRWQCSRSSVDRIAERAGLSRVFLGQGRNGMVRFRRDEVEAFEASRTAEGGLRCRS